MVFIIVEYSGVDFQNSCCQVISSNFTQLFEISSLSWLSCRENIIFAPVPELPMALWPPCYESTRGVPIKKSKKKVTKKKKRKFPGSKDKS